MIKNITKFVFALLLSITYLHADVVTINGVEWEYCDDYYWNSDETIGVAITGASQVSGELIIPSKINGRSVTSIECDAFSGCSGLTSVTIPDSVTSIGHTAFYNCTNLKSVNLGNGIKRLGWNNDSWEGIFEGCINLTNIKIPASVEEIGEYAFKGCDKIFYDLKTIPGVKILDGWVVGYTKDCPSKIDLTNFNKIADGAFDGCTVLTSVKLSNSLKQIRYDVFSGCKNLTSITIPNSVTSIGCGAFSGCSGLTSITIPDSVTSIGDWAFGGCNGLTSVTIPESVEYIHEWAFMNCGGLKSFIVSPNNPSYKSVNGLLLSKDGTSLIAGINGDVVITNSVTRIEGDAFSGCRGLTSITIPDSVTSIGDWAFSGCSNLKSAIFLGDAPEFVGDDIFDNCVNGFVIKVKKGTKGWNGDYTSTALPTTWHGYPIEYATESAYKVVFNANGGSGSMPAQTIACNTSTKLRANAFKRTGYTFLGWAKTKTGAVAYKNAAAVKNLRSTAGTVTLYAKWAKTKYKIAFYANGGKGSMSAQSMTYNKAAYLKKNAFKRTGYTFAGWAKSKNGAVVYKNGQAVKNLTTTGGTVKLYAKWKPISYKVIFYGYGGKGSMSAQTIPVNKAAYLKKNAFKRTGYTFAGWAKSAALAKKGKVAYKNRQVVKNLLKKSGTVKLIAVWKPITYKVVFYPNGGSGKAIAQSMTYNKAAYLKKNIYKRSGYIFLGWAKSKNGAVAYKNVQAVKNLRSTKGTIKLYAVWAKPKYKVAFYANGGSGSMSAQSMTYNKAAYLKKNTFKRTGYTFAGWAKSSTGSVVYSDGKAVKNLTRTGGTVKLYAKWKQITCKIIFHPNGGFGSSVSQTLTYKKSANLRSNTFTCVGYTFAGWATSADGDVEYKDAISVTYTGSTSGYILNLYAVWKLDTSKIDNGHKGVQLWAGGPYWATTNIGAENPEDYGYYFWWGDTIGYKRVNDQWVASDGSSSNFSFTSAYTPTFGKSNSELQSEGWITSNGVLAPEHDAARAHCGSNWRMPTDSELQALCDNCTWTLTTKNGVNGYVVSGKGAYSGASIFLPCAGYGLGTSLHDDSLHNEGWYWEGHYWSSVPNSHYYGYDSWLLSLYSSYSLTYGNRGYGRPVRPVLDVH